MLFCVNFLSEVKSMIENKLINLGVFKDFKDNSIKSVFKSENNDIIEMTLIQNKSCDVVCVPTHHFCNLGCKMCHLTNNKLNKNMIPIKIGDFTEALCKSLCFQNSQFKRRTEKRNLLISFMGVGEPLLNQQLILDFYKNETFIKNFLNYDEISYAISTTIPNLNLFHNLMSMVDINNIPLKVHFSLHTPFDNKRFNLLPSAKTSVSQAISLLNEYREILQGKQDLMKQFIKFHTSDIPVEIHYTLIKDNNDSIEELNEVYNIVKENLIPIKFLTFNPKDDLEVSDKQSIWLKKLKEIPNAIINTYSPPGKEIGSSCGEFTKHYYHEEIETEEEYQAFLSWKNKHKILD